jgi:hypothetical protein
MEIAVAWIEGRMTGSDVCICFEIQDCCVLKVDANSVTQSTPALKHSRCTTQKRRSDVPALCKHLHVPVVTIPDFLFGVTARLCQCIPNLAAMVRRIVDGLKRLGNGVLCPTQKANLVYPLRN